MRKLNAASQRLLEDVTPRCPRCGRRDLGRGCGCLALSLASLPVSLTVGVTVGALLPGVAGVALGGVGGAVVALLAFRWRRG